MGSKAKWVPGFLVSWLKRIAHQDQVNAFLWESRDKVGTPWLEACIEYLQVTLKIEGMENLPAKDDGRLYTFVSNHPLGGADGVALGAIIGRHYDSRFRYLVNDLLMYLPGSVGQRRSYQRAWNTSVTLYPSILAVRTLISSTAWQISPTVSYPSTSPCFSSSTRCTRTSVRLLR